MSEGTAFAVCARPVRGTENPMKNARTAVAAVLVAGSAFVWSLGSAPSGATVPAPDRDPSPTAVVRANAEVDEALVALAGTEAGDGVTVVRVTGQPLQELLADPGFLGNVHELQDYLNNHDAGALRGADVSITDVLAVEVGADGSAVLYTR